MQFALCFLWTWANRSLIIFGLICVSLRYCKKKFKCHKGFNILVSKILFEFFFFIFANWPFLLQVISLICEYHAFTFRNVMFEWWMVWTIRINYSLSTIGHHSVSQNLKTEFKKKQEFRLYQRWAVNLNQNLWWKFLVSIWILKTF